VAVSDELANTKAFDWEREKWQADFRLRERELALKDKELEQNRLELRLKRVEDRRARWTSPLVLALLAATVAAGGNAYVAYLNGEAQRELERTRGEAQITLEQEKSEAEQAIEETKAEAARILEVIKTGDQKTARDNLAFLNEVGLIANEKLSQDIRIYLEKLKPGEGPALPANCQTKLNRQYRT
jgi:hypothetical protein